MNKEALTLDLSVPVRQERQRFNESVDGILRKAEHDYRRFRGGVRKRYEGRLQKAEALSDLGIGEEVMLGRIQKYLEKYGWLPLSYMRVLGRMLKEREV